MALSTLATIVCVLAMTAGMGLDVANGHGSMEMPASRVYNCRFNENPESPTSAACRAAVELRGPQPFYDWNEVNLGDVAGAHRERIPDGQLCSAGRDKYVGLDLARDDWFATDLVSGAFVTFIFHASAPHRGFFEFYITRDSYVAMEPLKWSDLEDTPFLVVSDPLLQNNRYIIEGTIPSGKSGRHLIYVIWQRTDSPEAFYSCSDVVLYDSGSTSTSS